MPATNNPGGKGYTLTFSQKNQDAKKLIDKRKEEGLVFTDYICEAVRFYEANRDKNQNLIELIDEIVDKKVEEKVNAKMIAIMSSMQNFTIVANTQKEEAVTKEDTRSLEEDNLDIVNVDED